MASDTLIICQSYFILAIRIEWCRAQAQAHRWEEEVALLFEEMQRMLWFLEWHAKWWMDQTGMVVTTDKMLSEGHHAYAEHQAGLWDQIRLSFAHTWRDMKCFLELADIVREELV